MTTLTTSCFRLFRSLITRPCSMAGLAAVGLLMLSGCEAISPPPIPRGALVEKMDYDQLVLNSSTQNDALSILGSPTAHATFNDNTWIYISMTKDLVPLAHPVIDKQQVLVLNFDNSGILRKMNVLNKRDAIHVHMAGGVTPTPGTHISVIQELLGNVGRYNPMNSMGNTFGGMGNGMGPMSGQGTGNGGVGNSMP
ncbi:outer membrane protein assembly factor BamE [Bombella sp. ESL0378]|nr:outer membrane protein assembly factor BamE [Bombella sp. ESL0378]MUG90388.1 outer membrane protein assembly factor BamE [Bombella sp. ESL0385]